jgi:NTP pyrophosphatase (non-canonical NTP hydrolase)
LALATLQRAAISRGLAGEKWTDEDVVVYLAQLLANRERAAVALAMHNPEWKERARVLTEVSAERDRQELKWNGNVASVRDRFRCIAILGEEVGEVARAALEGDQDSYRHELIQVAAVAVAMVQGLSTMPQATS